MSNCPCDARDIFPALEIEAGLDRLPRQIGGFSRFRRAMLRSLRDHSALSGWNARDDGDPGLMLLEMWAYVCDVLSFYDEVIANENYLRTALLRPSLRKLTGLLGYRPRPAVSASVLLTALAQGRQALTLAAGTAFRSEAFGEQAPQVFELDNQTPIHPLNNSWKLSPRRPAVIGSGSAAGGAHPFVLLKAENKKLNKHDVVLIQNGSRSSVHTIEKRRKIIGRDDEAYIELSLHPALSLPAAVRLEDISLSTPTQTAGLWSMGEAPEAIPAGETRLILNGLYRQLKAGQFVLVSRGDKYRWFTLKKVRDTMMDATAGGEFKVTNTDDEPLTLTVPAVRAPATKLTLDAGLNDAARSEGDTKAWNNDCASEIYVHYAFISVGELTRQRDAGLDETSELVLAPAAGRKLEAPADSESPDCLVLRDVNGVSVQGNGSVDYASGALNFQGTDWNTVLTPPVKVFGNVLRASRGETVSREILGSGDASQSGQTFALKKHPLTYIAAPTIDDERGVSSTLKIRVDGVQWREVASFYGQGPSAAVYIVRHNDAHETRVIFGDGKRGRRLPSGKDNIIASYRYGAGAAAPPAGTITQAAKPVKGLTGLNNPFPAAGGDDAEPAEKIRDYAPQSALLLGRAVSLQDFIAAAAGMPGVQAVEGQWRWNNRRQRPVVQLWIIGGSDSAAITKALRNLSDPAIALDVDKAVAVQLRLTIQVEVDEALVKTDVLRNLRRTLTDPETGLLAPGNIGIGRPLYRSRLLAAILAVPGTLAVTHMTHHDQIPFDAIAIRPDPGKYFDVAGGGLLINGKESFDD